MKQSYRWKTPYNATAFPKDSETFSLPSLAVPDQNMSIRQILNRYAMGLPIAGGRVPLYEEDDDDLNDGVDIRKLDLSERMDLIRERSRELAELRLRNMQPQKPPADEKPADQPAE